MKATRKNGTRSIQLGIDNNPDVTKADFIPAKAAKDMKKGNLGLKFKVKKKKKKMAAEGLANQVGATAAKGMKYGKHGLKYKTAGKGMKYGK
jgi:hypothetical protein